MAGELLLGARSVVVLAVLALICAVAAVVVVIALPICTGKWTKGVNDFI